MKYEYFIIEGNPDIVVRGYVDEKHFEWAVYDRTRQEWDSSRPLHWRNICRGSDLDVFPVSKKEAMENIKNPTWYDDRNGASYKPKTKF